MENLSVAVSSSRTDYGSTTLKPPHHRQIAEDNDSTSENRLAIHSSSIFTHIPVDDPASSGFYQSLPCTSTTKLFERSPKRFGTYNSFKMSSAEFSKMSIDAAAKLANGTRQKIERLEILLNVLNQMCIGFVTIYMSWLCLRTGLSGTALHAWLVTIGFSFLMAEGVMCHYSANVLTSSYKRKTKTTIHWILQALGGGLGVVGALIKCIEKGFLLHSIHGKLGFAAFILCLVSMLSGLAALFSMRIKQCVSPLLNRTLHNLLGFLAFLIALLAQYYGYQTGFFSSKVDTDFQMLMEGVTLTSLILTSIGPLKTLTMRISNAVKHFGTF